jgi:AcrR family transcriptional regulator
MPKFTDEKRQATRTALLDAGRELFTAEGLDETTIDELTTEAGIATGTFYSFFDSKPQLLAAVLRREAEHVYADLRVVLKEHRDDPEAALRQFVEVASDALVANPLFRRTIDREDRDQLHEELSDAEVLATQSEKLDLLVPHVEAWQEQGKLADGDAETIALGVLYVSYLPLHREEIGDDRYPAVRQLLTDWMISGLVTSG